VSSTPPKLFVSDSWTSPADKEWVLRLASHLREQGVNVIVLIALVIGFVVRLESWSSPRQNAGGAYSVAGPTPH